MAVRTLDRIGPASVTEPASLVCSGAALPTDLHYVAVEALECIGPACVTEPASLVCRGAALPADLHGERRVSLAQIVSREITSSADSQPIVALAVASKYNAAAEGCC